MIISNEEEMEKFGQQLASSLKSGDIVALHGDLGAGKTTLVKGIVGELTLLPKQTVQSPTFTHLHIYESELPIYHFDLYRLKGANEFIQLGFLDFLEENGICLIEWAERISSLLPPNTIHVELSQAGEGKRKIDVYKS